MDDRPPVPTPNTELFGVSFKIKEEPMDYDVFPTSQEDACMSEVQSSFNSPCSSDRVQSQNMADVTDSIKQELHTNIFIKSEPEFSGDEFDSSFERRAASPVFCRVKEESLYAGQNFDPDKSVSSASSSVLSGNGFICLVCKTSFKSEELLKSSPDDIQPFPCPVCLSKVNKEQEVKVHEASSTNKKLLETVFHEKTGPNSSFEKQASKLKNIEEYICHVCEKSCKSKDLLEIHLKSHEVLPFRCPYCPSQFKWHSDFIFHTNAHKNNKIKRKKEKFICHSCNKCCKSKSLLEIHLKSHDVTLPFQCPFCPSQFKWNSDLIFHTNTHKKEKKKEEFICHTCKKPCASKNLLEIHMKSHDERLPFQCPFCPSQFKWNSDFIFHKTTHKNKIKSLGATYVPETEEIICNICKKSCRTETSLNNHMKHHEETQFLQCPKCPFRIEWKSHMVTHFEPNGRKFFKCSHCFKKVRFRSQCTCSLKAHIETHVQEYTCDTCKKVFKSKNSLIYHLQFHDESRTYQCSICLYRFISKTSLECHEAVHANERLFKCTLCPKSFNANVYLLSHMKSHIPMKEYRAKDYRYMCVICIESFRSKTALKAHTNRHEGIEPSDTPILL